MIWTQYKRTAQEVTFKLMNDSNVGTIEIDTISAIFDAFKFLNLMATFSYVFSAHRVYLTS